MKCIAPPMGLSKEGHGAHDFEQFIRQRDFLGAQVLAQGILKLADDTSSHLQVARAVICSGNVCIHVKPANLLG